MDYRRWNTGECLAAGVTDRAIPESDVPKDREYESLSGDESPRVEDVRAAIEAGKVVNSPNYYGIPTAWKADNGKYRGTLFQYRMVSEAPTFETLNECVKWFRESCYATMG